MHVQPHYGNEDFFLHSLANLIYLIQFGVSEKHAKFGKIFLTLWTFTKKISKA